MEIKAISHHATLPDMPSATNDDHDGRYYTQEQVDALVAGLHFDMFFDDLDSGINDPVAPNNDYYSLHDMDTGDAATTLTGSALGQGDDQEVISYISSAALPFEELAPGLMNVHIHARKNGTGQKSAVIFGKFYHRASDTTETLIATSEDSPELDNNVTEYNLHATLSGAVAFSATDRLLIKIRANIGSSGGNAQVEITQEGTFDSHISSLVDTDTLSNIFLRLDGAHAMTGTLDMGTNGITNVSSLTGVSGNNLGLFPVGGQNIECTGRIQIPVGSEAAPSLFFAGFPSDGIYFANVSSHPFTATGVGIADDLIIEGTNTAIRLIQNSGRGFFYRASNSAQPNNSLNRALGTFASPLAVTTDTLLGVYAFQGYDGSNYFNAGGYQMAADEDWGTGPNRRGSRMEFRTVVNGETAAAVRMTLDNTGTLNLLDGGFTMVSGTTAIIENIQAPAAFGLRIYNDSADLVATFADDGDVDIVDNITAGGTGTFNVVSSATFGTFSTYVNVGTELSILGAGGKLKLFEAGTPTSYTSFQCPSIAANIEYVLPDNKGDADQVLSTNGASPPILDWVDNVGGGAQIATGSYTGDGSTSKAITGVGFAPKFVKIWMAYAAGNLIAIETTDLLVAVDANGVAHKHEGGTHSQIKNAIISLDADGFTVDDAGTDSHPNTTGGAYTYLCLG